MEKALLAKKRASEEAAAIQQSLADADAALKKAEQALLDAEKADVQARSAAKSQYEEDVKADTEAKRSLAKPTYDAAIENSRLNVASKRASVTNARLAVDKVKAMEAAIKQKLASNEEKLKVMFFEEMCMTKPNRNYIQVKNMSEKQGDSTSLTITVKVRTGDLTQGIHQTVMGDQCTLEAGTTEQWWRWCPRDVEITISSKNFTKMLENVSPGSGIVVTNSGIWHKSEIISGF